MKSFLQQLDDLNQKLRDLVAESEEIREHALKFPLEAINSFQMDLPDGVNPDDISKVVDTNLDLTQPH